MKGITNESRLWFDPFLAGMKRFVVLIGLCVGLFGGVGFAAEIGGVGIVIGKQGDAVVIMTVLPGTPAAASNALKKSDRIIAIAQDDAGPVKTSGTNIAQVVQMLRGPIGSVVRLTIIPAGADASQIRAIPLVRVALAPKLYDTAADGKQQIVVALKQAGAENKRIILKFGTNW
ncbi:MAG: S41 family peptidase [Limisphaerales bacterium]